MTLRHRQDRRDLRVARRVRLAALHGQHGRLRPPARAGGRARSGVRVREPRGLRHGLGAPQRRRGLRARPGGGGRAHAGAARRDATKATCSSSRADHGCDPTTPSTDHSREYSPLLAKVKGVDAGRRSGTRSTFADIGETVLDFYGLAGTCGRGTSFLDGGAQGMSGDHRGADRAQARRRQALAGGARAHRRRRTWTGAMPDYQMAAWLMAAFIRGLDHDETVWLTDAMAHSGRVVDLAGVPGTSRSTSTRPAASGTRRRSRWRRMVAACGGPRGEDVRPRPRPHRRDARQAGVDPGLPGRDDARRVRRGRCATSGAP